MTVVEELSDARGTSYSVRHDDGTLETVRTTCSRQTVNGIETFVVRDAHMGILMSPSLFLTYDLEWEARNTASQAVSAIKALMNFCSIIQIPFEAFDIGQARSFMQFLRGTLSEGATYSFRLLTARSETTIGAYLGSIRRYARYLGVSNSPFLQSKSAVAHRSKVGMSPIDDGHKRKTDAHRLRANIVESKEVPRYVSPDEYKSVLSEIDAHWSIEESCIVRLMYEHGLRIGEVLGLTVEDLEHKVNSHGLPVYMVVLRNRVSDRSDQHAKTLMKVIDTRQYQSADYKRRNVGTQRIYISESLFYQICDYAESALPEESDDFGADAALADSVTGRNENHYLFLNTHGRPLSQNLWNKRLRKIMQKAGLHVDTGERRTNLNHRFRHGYAMFLTHEARSNGHPLDEFSVMTLMRHRSPRSTAVYQNPTEDDIARMQEEIIGPMQEKLYGENAEE